MSEQSEATIAQSPPVAETGINLRPDTETDDHQDVYPGSTLVLVGCGKAKRDPEGPVDVPEAAIGPQETVGQGWQDETGPAWEAQDLYTSTYFSAKREFAETVTRWDGDPDSTPWGILSAEHKVLFPWEKVTSYDTTIEDIGDDPLDADDRVAGSFGRLRPDGQEIDAEGVGEQMAYLSDVVARHETDRELTEQADLVDSMTATDGVRAVTDRQDAEFDHEQGNNRGLSSKRTYIHLP